MNGVLRTRATLTLFVIALSASEPERSFADGRNVLSFQQRVAYQYAIEQVYWRHRIWPKERPDPKPSLDEVMPPAQIEKKVQDYLRNSGALVDYWQQPLSAEQLQAEMERMAQHTKQPEVLRELFTALGNDPFVIAECLARPALSERLLSSLQQDEGRYSSTAVVKKGKDPLKLATIEWGKEALESWRTRAESEMREVMAAVSADYTMPAIPDGVKGCTDDTWTATTTTNAPSARSGHTAVWTGSEMIVWGGTGDSTGGRYTPVTDSWTATSTTNAPSARNGHTAVWTGNEMIVWGGGSYLNTGGRYNPSTDSWTATTTTIAPAARNGHTAVWTGSEMIVWGGWNGASYFITGGRYNPGTDSWTATGTINVIPRSDHTAVWTGNEMIVWGGQNNFGMHLNSGQRYNPITNNWTGTSMANAPSNRIYHTAIWTGSEMVVWGGTDFGTLNTGAKYDPSTNTWTATTTNNAPSQRFYHTAVWTGDEMIVWGGESFNTGGRYNPSTDSWAATSTTNAPNGRTRHTALWTGREMIVWGGSSGGNLNSGGIYCAEASAPVVQRAVSRKAHGSAAGFDIDLPLGGTSGIECRGGGLISDYTIIVTFQANVAVSGSPQAAVTSGIGTIGSGGVSNGGMVLTSGNTVTIPLTNVANAQAINVTLNNVNGSTNVSIPMRLLIGDVNGDGFVNSGDAQQTRNRSGQTTSATNFRSDVNVDGVINSGDTTAVRSRSGTALP